MTRFPHCIALRSNLGIAAILIASILLPRPAHCQTANALGSAHIASVSSISPQAWQTIVIRGSHFGVNPPFNGCTDTIRITDVNSNAVFPGRNFAGGCNYPILVTSWTETEIVIGGLPAFKRGEDAFKIGDTLKIEVRNPKQNSAPMAWYSVRVTPPGMHAPAPAAPASLSTPEPESTNPGTAKVISVGRITPKAWQTIVINGTHFGVNPPFNGCTDTIRITDVNSNAVFPGRNFAGGCNYPILVTSWTETEIVIEGLPALKRGQDAFKIGDTLKIEVSNGKQGSAPMDWYSLKVTPEGMPPLPPPLRTPVATSSSECTEAPVPMTGHRTVFSKYRELDPKEWQTSTPLLAAFAKMQDTEWVEPQLTFDQFGMTLSGVNGRRQFTGIQSRKSFTPPFFVRATVMGSIANGNPFCFYLVSEDLSQTLKMEGNLNPDNGPYHGLWISAGNAQGVNVLPNVGIQQWYTPKFAVNAHGVGRVTIADSRGAILATQTDLPVGMGPFFVVLGQREGLPYTVGPNQAVWSFVELVSE